ncbi:MAG: hypothetical protein J6B16_00555 [Clostridia bacterium]|nr:hypothetical protein [Clostridia bacterium]
MKKDINYALVEDKRPPLYTCMKYWGKKPHNIWREYISNYTSNGLFLDPFCGSAMSAFESFVAGKKTFACDLNPLSSFVIEVVCSDFDEKVFTSQVEKIIATIFDNQTYKKLYRYLGNDYIVHNVKYNEDIPYEISLVDVDGKNKKCMLPSKADMDVIELSKELIINKKYPTEKFRESDSFQNSFREHIGNSFSDLYTRRNLWVLSEIFNLILEVADETLKKQLLYAFIQTVHLSTKMCVPRSKSTNRDFSTSWGRSAYIYSKKQMEMNPLLVFRGCCLEKQSVLKSLLFAKKYFPKKPIIADVNTTKYNPDNNVDIWYGVIDVQKLSSYLPEKSVEFILTDPPYGGLIQYLDLSSIWLSWLGLYDNKYKPKYDLEITVNGKKDCAYFEESFTNALRNINKVLQDDGKLVLIFNNKDTQVWGTFLKAIENAGFRIEKVIHQQNKRSGESNVSDSYGMSASDYYIRCIKTDKKYLQPITKSEVEKILINLTKEIIEKRNEPTPFQILFNGLLAEMSLLNVDISNFNTNIEKFLLRYLDKEFIITQSAINKAGAYWWIKNKEYNKDSKDTLTNKVEKFIIDNLNKKALTSDELLKQLFKNFPNGLTPDIEVVFAILEKNATIKNNYWVVK